MEEGVFPPVDASRPFQPISRLRWQFELTIYLGSLYVLGESGFHILVVYIRISQRFPAIVADLRALNLQPRHLCTIRTEQPIIGFL